MGEVGGIGFYGYCIHTVHFLYFAAPGLSQLVTSRGSVNGLGAAGGRQRRGKEKFVKKCFLKRCQFENDISGSQFWGQIRAKIKHTHTHSTGTVQPYLIRDARWNPM